MSMEAPYWALLLKLFPDPYKKRTHYDDAMRLAHILARVLPCIDV